MRNKAHIQSTSPNYKLWIVSESWPLQILATLSTLAQHLRTYHYTSVIKIWADSMNLPTIMLLKINGKLQIIEYTQLSHIFC